MIRGCARALTLAALAALTAAGCGTAIRFGGGPAPSPTPLTGVILFASNRNFNWEIYVMNPDASGLTRLTTHLTDDKAPAFDPTRTRIAFTSMRDGNSEIYLMSADGSGQTNLTRNFAQDFHPRFSPDGTRILSIRTATLIRSSLS